MKTINLRYHYYPYYKEDVLVEVSDEVAEVIIQSVRQMYNYDRRARYHKAIYSLNAFEWSENYAVEHSPSPEEILLLKEEQAAHERLLSLLDEAFSVVTPMQARRIRSYYLRGLDFTQIGREEHVDKSVVNRSVHRGLKYMRDYYERQKTE